MLLAVAAPSRIPPDSGDRLRTVHRAMVEAVLTGQGLTRIAELAEEAAEVPVVVLLPGLGPPALSAGASPLDLDAVRRYVDGRMSGSSARVPDWVAFEEAVVTGGEMVGCVVALAAPADPEGTEVLHLAALACLTEIAVHDARDSGERTVRATFLEDLRTRPDQDPAEIVRRAARLRCDLRLGGVALCAEIASERPHHVVAAILDEVPGGLAQALAGDPPRVYALLPLLEREEDSAELIARARRAATRLRRYGLVGMSGYTADPAGLGRALQEAELVVEVLRRGELPPGEGAGAGTYRLLFRVLASHPEELRAFCEETVAPILRYDEQYSTELAGTLEAYLGHNCNMNATASAVFAHRHTVAYRLERVRELTGLDPMQTEDRERLGLGLKAFRLIAPGARQGPAPGQTG